MNLGPKQTAHIQAAFAEMQGREDLLDLLNSVSSILNRDFFADMEEASLLENEGELKFSVPEKVPVKSSISAKQFNFFSTSFDESPKKRKRYKQFFIVKKSGSLREINAPFPKLLEIQQALNAILQTLFTVQEPAFGFAPGKNIAGNAAGHVGKNFVLNADIKDFFPSIHFRRVKVMLEKPPFNLSGDREPLAFAIANLCTENGVLPQGAATSPLLTNIICQRLDKKLQTLAAKFKVHYSRYADDLSFSSNEYAFTKRFLQQLEAILASERFRLNPEKTRIQGRAYRQEVTGLTVNEKLNVNRRYLRSYRTLVHLYNSKGAKAATEYLLKRMPIGLEAFKMARKVDSLDNYIRRVIAGKYNFIKQVKGVQSPKHPFGKETPGPETPTEIHTLASKLSGLANFKFRLIEPEADEQVKRFYKTILDNEDNAVVEEPVVSYGQASEILNDNVAGLIDKVLAVWEDNKEGGFEKAMEIFKQEIHEQ